MRVAIAGAGAVGRSIARELIQNGHEVLLIDKDPSSIKPERVPDAEWLRDDSCGPPRKRPPRRQPQRGPPRRSGGYPPRATCPRARSPGWTSATWSSRPPA